MKDARATAERVARAAYGRLVALLAARSRDVIAAEDALADAFAQAVSHWPVAGVPAKPEAWLLTVARNRLTDSHRREARAPVAAVASEDLPDMALPDVDPDAIPDDRLKLLFACAHPAIDVNLHTPLMLQCVLGLEAREIARAFLVPPDAMAQRLVRAKRKIRDAGIPFVLPDRDDMPPRLEAVLEAIYGAVALDWPGGASSADGLGGEALFLAETVAALLPVEPEAAGLAALIAHSEARAEAGLAALDTTLARQDRFQPALVARGHFLEALGRREEAVAALAAALALTVEPALRAFLEEKHDRLTDPPPKDLPTPWPRLC